MSLSDRRYFWIWYALIGAALLFANSANANNLNFLDGKKPSPASTSLQDYLQKVRAAGTESPSSTGSLWVSSGPLASLASDYKARWTGDLVVVRLVDTFSAATRGGNNTPTKFR